MQELYDLLQEEFEDVYIDLDIRDNRGKIAIMVALENYLE